MNIASEYEFVSSPFNILKNFSNGGEQLQGPLSRPLTTTNTFKTSGTVMVHSSSNNWPSRNISLNDQQLITRQMCAT